MSDQPRDEVDLVALLQSIWRRKYIVIPVTIVFGLVAIYIALTATPKYRASVLVAKVDESNMSAASSLVSQFGGLGRLAGVSVGRNGPAREAQAILGSRRLAEEFIVRNDIQSQLRPDGAEPMTLWFAVQRFRDTVLGISEDDINGTSVVSMEWTDAETAAHWANSYVGLANELIRSGALTQSESNIAYLREQADSTNTVELERVIYNLIEAEMQKLMLANARDEYAFTVVDPAVAPEMRSKPQRKLIVLSGGALGFLVAVLGVLLWDFAMRIVAPSPDRREPA